MLLLGDRAHPQEAVAAVVKVLLPNEVAQSVEVGIALVFIHVAQRRCHIHLLRGDTRTLGESPLLETLEIVLRVSVCIHAFMHACIPRLGIFESRTCCKVAPRNFI